MLLPYVTILICAATVAVGAPFIDVHIVGGKNASIQDFPYQVSLRNGKKHICGGSILNKNYVVTANHCVRSGNATDFSIRVGASLINADEGEIYPVDSKHLFNCTGYHCDGDVAVLKLKKAITFGPKAQPISLVPQNQEPIPGEILTVAGWGLKSSQASRPSELLQVVQIPAVDRNSCRKLYGSNPNSRITEKMICAGGVKGKGVCFYDSGSALINAKKQLVGLVAWGRNCATSNIPQVYTNVANPAVHQFIVEHSKQ